MEPTASGSVDTTEPAALWSRPRRRPVRRCGSSPRTGPRRSGAGRARGAGCPRGTTRRCGGGRPRRRAGGRRCPRRAARRTRRSCQQGIGVGTSRPRGRERIRRRDVAGEAAAPVRSRQAPTVIVAITQPSRERDRGGSRSGARGRARGRPAGCRRGEQRRTPPGSRVVRRGPRARGAGTDTIRPHFRARLPSHWGRRGRCCGGGRASRASSWSVVQDDGMPVSRSDVHGQAQRRRCNRRPARPARRPPPTAERSTGRDR